MGVDRNGGQLWPSIAAALRRSTPAVNSGKSDSVRPDAWRQRRHTLRSRLPDMTRRVDRLVLSVSCLVPPFGLPPQAPRKPRYPNVGIPLVAPCRQLSVPCRRAARLHHCGANPCCRCWACLWAKLRRMTVQGGHVPGLPLAHSTQVRLSHFFVLAGLSDSARGP